MTARWIGAIVLAALVLGGGVLAYQMGASDRGAEAKRQEERANAAATEKARQEESKRLTDAVATKKKADDEAQAKRAAEEEAAERQRLALLKAEEERVRAEAAAKRKAEEEAARRDPALSVKPGSGQSFRDRLADGQPCPMCPEMVVLPAGGFMMGSNEYDSEKPPHRVTIQRPVAVGKFEVTFAEWDACVAAGGCKHRPGDEGWGRGRRPVINVSWHDAKEYAVWLSRKTGKLYRLLSEAEWEYAARAGTTTRYSFGDTISTSHAQYNASKTVEVDWFPANTFGLQDMNGNEWEWVEDAWHPNYQGAPQDGSVRPGGAFSRVLRGGSWNNVNPDILRSAKRAGYNPDVRRNFIGFRLARTL